MTADADLYFDEMDLAKYCTGQGCTLCKVDSFDEFLTRLRDGRLRGGACPHWSESRVAALRLAVDAGDVIGPIPQLDIPRPMEPVEPGEPGVLELNDAGPHAPLLVTGNSQFTQSVMLAVLALAVSPLRLLTVDVRGHTVDMAVVFKEFTAARVSGAFADCGVDPAAPSRIILPGLAAGIAPELATLFGRPIEIGPICAAEIPLYMGDDWVAA